MWQLLVDTNSIIRDALAGGFSGGETWLLLHSLEISASRSARRTRSTRYLPLRFFWILGQQISREFLNGELDLFDTRLHRRRSANRFASRRVTPRWLHGFLGLVFLKISQKIIGMITPLPFHSNEETKPFQRKNRPYFVYWPQTLQASNLNVPL